MNLRQNALFVVFQIIIINELFFVNLGIIKCVGKGALNYSQIHSVSSNLPYSQHLGIIATNFFHNSKSKFLTSFPFCNNHFTIWKSLIFESFSFFILDFAMISISFERSIPTIFTPVSFSNENTQVNK